MKKLSVHKALLKAKSCVKKGKIEEAQKLYQAVLQVFPMNKRAEQGLIALKKGKQHSVTHGPPQEAINQLFNLYKQKQLPIVVKQATTLTKQYPEAFIIWIILGTAHKGLGKTFEASEAFKKVIELNPNYVDGHSSLGDTLKMQGKLDEAIASYEKALSLKPDYVEGYNKIGLVLKNQGKHDEAIASYGKALSLKPDSAVAYYNIGNALKSQGKLEEAIDAYRKSLLLKPDNSYAYRNIGNALKAQGKLEEAIEAYNKSLAIKPNCVDAYYNMGNAFKEQGKLEEAIEAYNKSLAIESDYAEARINRSLALLAAKDFDQGFIESEWRWKTKERNKTFLQSTKPIWNGEKNQRVLVWGEQGIGDELMFSSIIPELYATSFRVLVKCDKRLIPLFERSFPADVIYFSKEQSVPEDEYDFHIPMGSLPLTFRKSLDSFKKSASGFLKCDMSKVESIKAQLMHKYDKKIVGISWKTAAPIRESINRNINFAELARALDSSNTQLLCLQYGDVSDEIEAVKRDFGIEVIQFSEVDNKNDIDGLASLILACDQIVSTTNVTVHLAGALGAKVTALLPFSPRWIWGDGSESFWYDSATPLKQNLYQNWGNVLENLDLNKCNLAKKNES